jgi:hypothetical protein
LPKPDAIIKAPAEAAGIFKNLDTAYAIAIHPKTETFANIGNLSKVSENVDRHTAKKTRDGIAMLMIKVFKTSTFSLLSKPNLNISIPIITIRIAALIIVPKSLSLRQQLQKCNVH